MSPLFSLEQVVVFQHSSHEEAVVPPQLTQYQNLIGVTSSTYLGFSLAAQGHPSPAEGSSEETEPHKLCSRRIHLDPRTDSSAVMVEKRKTKAPARWGKTPSRLFPDRKGALKRNLTPAPWRFSLLETDFSLSQSLQPPSARKVKVKQKRRR